MKNGLMKKSDKKSLKSLTGIDLREKGNKTGVERKTGVKQSLSKK
ncbi:hypothetical protein [Nostoc sp. TCL26-01]|nr:hypothetical protein [Nostoc sp. TCL26-01]